MRRGRLDATGQRAPHRGAAAWSQDRGRQFHWQGKLAADQLVAIKNVNSDIDASTGDVDQVEVTAEKSGRNADQIHIEVVPGHEGLPFAPSVPDLRQTAAPHFKLWQWAWDNGKVHFTIRLPNTLRFAADNVNGNVHAADVGRAVRANSVNGNVNVSTAAWAEAGTGNGAIKASMAGAGWNGYA